MACLGNQQSGKNTRNQCLHTVVGSIRERQVLTYSIFSMGPWSLIYNCRCVKRASSLIESIKDNIVEVLPTHSSFKNIFQMIFKINRYATEKDPCSRTRLLSNYLQNNPRVSTLKTN